MNYERYKLTDSTDVIVKTNVRLSLRLPALPALIASPPLTDTTDVILKTNVRLSSPPGPPPPRPSVAVPPALPPRLPHCPLRLPRTHAP
ncbi:unnamed protein product [Closterium sp. Naga37s-1]|nr:unnamed protein product [Closterium sp. Naga37s-1]